MDMKKEIDWVYDWEEDNSDDSVINIICIKAPIIEMTGYTKGSKYSYNVNDIKRGSIFDFVNLRGDDGRFLFTFNNGYGFYIYDYFKEI